MQLPCQVAISSVRGNETRDGDGAAVSEQFGDFTDATDVFGAVGGGEAEVFVQAEADVIAVEAVGGEVVRCAEEGLFERDGDGGFAGGGEAGEPDCEALLLAEGCADGGGEGGGVVCYVAGRGLGEGERG